MQHSECDDLQLTEEEKKQILEQRDAKERKLLINQIVWNLDPHFKGTPFEASFGTMAFRMNIHTLRGILAGIKSRKQDGPRSYISRVDYDD